MQMVHRLSRVVALIDHHAIAVFKTQLVFQLRDFQKALFQRFRAGTDLPLPGVSCESAQPQSSAKAPKTTATAHINAADFFLFNRLFSLV